MAITSQFQWSGFDTIRKRYFKFSNEQVEIRFVTSLLHSNVWWCQEDASWSQTDLKHIQAWKPSEKSELAKALLNISDGNRE